MKDFCHVGGTYAMLTFIVVLGLLLPVCQPSALAVEKPKYIGIYLEKGGNLFPIGWLQKPERALVIEDNSFSIISYGISLNLGGGGILNPAEVVGLQEEGSKSYFYLNIEPLDMKENYFRYQLPDSRNLPDGLYFFFITSAIWGEKAKDKYYFRVQGKK